MIIPTYEERKANERERMKIITTIMGIQNHEDLHALNIIANQLYTAEMSELPIPLNDFVDLLDMPILVQLMDIFKNESSEYLVNKQIKELLQKAINDFVSVEEDAKETA